jgi:hypothetical protein
MARCPLTAVRNDLNGLASLFSTFPARGVRVWKGGRGRGGGDLKSRMVGKPRITTPGKVKSFFVPSIFPTKSPLVRREAASLSADEMEGASRDWRWMNWPSERMVGSIDLQCPHLRR